MIQTGSQVSIHYTVALEDGEIVDRNQDETPMVFTLGEEEILPALEKALLGRTVGEVLDVQVSPEHGYGPVNPEAFQTVELNVLPEESRQPGAALSVEDEAGQRHLLHVHEIQGDKVILDFNHPLAGKTLLYHVEIVDIK